MAIKNIVMRPEGVGDYADELHPKTNADQIVETTTKKVMTDVERTKLAGIATGAQVNTVSSVAGKTGEVTLAKADVGLDNVTNDAQMPIAGGTFIGVAVGQNNTSYATKQLRNITLSTSSPSGGSNGDVWIKYV